MLDADVGVTYGLRGPGHDIREQVDGTQLLYPYQSNSQQQYRHRPACFEGYRPRRSQSKRLNPKP